MAAMLGCIVKRAEEKSITRSAVVIAEGKIERPEEIKSFAAFRGETVRGPGRTAIGRKGRAGVEITGPPIGQNIRDRI